MSEVVCDGKNLSCLLAGKVVFCGVNFQVKWGDLLILNGSNGSGKSTFLRMLAGIIKPIAGQLFVSDTINKTSYLGHKYAVNEDLTVWHNLSYWYNLYSGQQLVVKNIINILECCGLTNLLTRQVTYLSAGQKKRVALARIMLSKAQLLLLDEPIALIDIKYSQYFINYIDNYIKQGNIVIISMNNRYSGNSSDTLDLDRYQFNSKNFYDNFWQDFTAGSKNIY